jgi:N-methylhydantoinase A/oxoprolinase/acetone carboxylase beta subunit
MSTYRVGIDIGGTFTDAAFVDEQSGAVQIVKVPSTPADPSAGFMAAVERGLQRCDSRGEAVRLVVHATTVATNALIEGKTASLGMLTTQGFRDILEIGRQIRARLYDVHLTKPRPLVSRRWSFGIRERLDAEGRVLEPLDVAAVRQAVRQCKAAGLEALVCCFLHSYSNPEPERLAAAVVHAEYPEAFLSVSSEVCPEFREYLRASTTAVNAAIMPLVSRYLDALESQLQARRITAPFYVMQSSGGVMSMQSARHKPVYMIESGPAAGVIAAGAFAAPHGYANVMSFDMGGTTAKVGLMQDGQVKLSTDLAAQGEALLAREGVATAQRRLLRSVDLRYQGQSHELSVAVPSGTLTTQTLAHLHEQFHTAHARAYGYDAREDAIELVNIRLTALGVSPKPRLPALPQGSPDPGQARKGQRPVWFSETGGFTSCPLLDRARLCWGNVVPGPAVIEELDATTLVHPGYQAAVDQYGNLVLRRC